MELCRVALADMATSIELPAMQARSFPRLTPTVQLLILALATLATRASTYDNPLYSADDQIYWLIGKGWLNGALPYVDIWDRKPPGLYATYAAIAAFGEPVADA